MVVGQSITVTDVTARSSNGYNFLKGKVFSHEKPKFAIQFLHGATEHIQRYAEFAEYICTKLECAVIAHDQCGHGASVFEKNEYGIIAARRGYNHIVNDTYGFLQEARKVVGDIPVFLMGYNMGSLIARASAVQFSNNYAGLILIGTSYKSLSMRLLLKKCKKEISINSETYLSPELHKKFALVYNKNSKATAEFEWLNSDEKELDKYLNDPICNFLLSASAIKDIVKIAISVNEAEWFKDMSDIPILILSGQEDPVCKFSEHSHTIAKRLKAHAKQDVSVITYEQARHDLLHEKCKQKVFDDIIDWVKTKAKKCSRP